MKKKQTVPVVLFVFNRPGVLKDTLNCLRKNNFDDLYVFADGPRNKEDQITVESVRMLVDEIDWVKTTKHYSRSNRGLSESIQYGLDKVFAKHGAAIVIEDDVCVAPGFYRYMCQALDTYYNNSQVAGVTGLRYPFSRENLSSDDADVFLAPRFSSWGWGTWSDRWKSLDFDSSSLLTKTVQLDNGKLFAGGEDLKLTYEALKKGELSGCWDVYFYLNMMLDDQYFVWPKYNMVENIDIGGGTHKSSAVPEWELSWENIDKQAFKIPKNLGLDDKILHDFKLFFNSGNHGRKTMKTKVKKAIKKFGFDVTRVNNDSSEKLDPKAYSTVGSSEVPCQKESYFYALNQYVKNGDRVLDVGMGIGYGMNLLSIKAKEVYAVDVDKKAVESCSKTVLGKNPKVRELKHYDGYHLPYKDNFFDVVTCVDVVEHVEDYDKFIDELLRVSKRVVFFATPNRRPEYTNPDGTPKNHWHLREWSYEELDTIMKSHAKHVDWAFLDGPWEGPFDTVKKVSSKTLVLMPTLHK